MYYADPVASTPEVNYFTEMSTENPRSSKLCIALGFKAPPHSLKRDVKDTTWSRESQFLFIMSILIVLDLFGKAQRPSLIH